MSDPELSKRAKELLATVEALEGRAKSATSSVESSLQLLEAVEEKRRKEIQEQDASLEEKRNSLKSKRLRQEEEISQHRLAQERDLQKEREATLEWKQEVEADVRRSEEVARLLISDKIAAFEFIADAWADYERGRAALEALTLEEKAHPAIKAAETVSKKGEELAEATRRAKAAEWIVALYEWHLPWITELRDQEEQTAYVEEAKRDSGTARSDDPASRWLSNEEFQALPEGERNQRALERYLVSRKSPWQLGRDYERYVGYLREQAGCSVTYHGIAKGMEDLGRDVLAEKGSCIEVIQCKRWSQRKTIHEKHVFQLFGTMILARLESPDREVSGTFTTTTSLSPKAREVADHLGIKVEQNFPLEEYPRIKCNIARLSEDRIYHLPFDQQYDTTIIEPDRGECYVRTVAEAEDRGFRRAWRWRG